ncbi:MAG: hypothetical protein JXQ71_17295 [Verrucomicrobia bacterium]|nr:hypothetical protein [Verrucomicrobiota bacterium]
MRAWFRRLAYKLSLFGYFKQTWQKLYSIPGNVDRQTRILQEQFVQNLLAQPRYADPRRLQRHEHQVYSQNGEDGVIAEIFRRIGTCDRTFLEIGVGDGLENNTVALLDQGWRGYWIDGDGSAMTRIRKTFWQPLAERRLSLHHATVTAEDAPAILARLQVPAEFDLFSLDIDRNTYFVWQALHAYRPRVVVMEYNSLYPPDVDWTVAYHPKLVYNCTSYMGASLKAYEKLGAHLGYALVGCELCGVNAFFVRRDLCGDKFAAPFTAEHHYEPPRYFLLRRTGHPRCFTDLRPPAQKPR